MTELAEAHTRHGVEDVYYALSPCRDDELAVSSKDGVSRYVAVGLLNHVLHEACARETVKPDLMARRPPLPLTCSNSHELIAGELPRQYGGEGCMILLNCVVLTQSSVVSASEFGRKLTFDPL